jgi:chlorobactene glucosyltransferase
VIVLIALSLGVLLVLALGSVAAARRPRMKARIDPAAPFSVPGPAPRISVCVPARNEERNIDACLAGLEAQDYPNLEIIVVDDRSTDGTAQILERHASQCSRLLVIRGEEPRDGWFGKPNALRQAIERSSGEWILMVDADTFHAPSSVRSVLAYALEQKIAAVSVLPRFLADTFWSKLLLPQLGALLLLGRNPRRVNEATSRSVFANGAYFLVRRDAYDAAGGIASVRSVLDEDVALARNLKSTGLGYHLVEGESICSERMYGSLTQFFAGFGKNVWSTLGRSLGRVLKLTIVVMVMSLAPLLACSFSLLEMGGVLSTSLDTPWLIIGAGQYPLITVLQALIRRRAGFPPHYALLAPLGGVVVLMIILNSALRGLFGMRVEWKGRRYPGV